MMTNINQPIEEPVEAAPASVTTVTPTTTPPVEPADLELPDLVSLTDEEEERDSDSCASLQLTPPVDPQDLELPDLIPVSDEEEHDDDSCLSLPLDEIISEDDVEKSKKQEESLTPSMYLENSSIDLGLLIGHMQVLQSLESLTQTKALASVGHCALKDRRLRARLHLLGAIERESLEEFQECYQLSDEDVLTIAMHIELCQELDEDVQWDLIFQILFPEPHWNNKIWDPLESLVALALEEDDYLSFSSSRSVHSTNSSI
jgi:hypothetical protein